MVWVWEQGNLRVLKVEGVISAKMVGAGPECCHERVSTKSTCSLKGAHFPVEKAS